MVKKEFNPLIFSALILIILIYGKVIKLPQNGLLTLLPDDQIAYIQGTVNSNPSKINDRYYSINLTMKNVTSNNGVMASASGIQKFLIPAEIVEAFYPEKLNSRNTESKSLIPIEQNVVLNGSVKIHKTEDNGNFFILEKINQSYFEDGFFSFLYKLRALCRIQFKRLMAAWGTAGGFLLALLSGSKEYLDPEMNNCFRLSGLSHILALSGMHLTLISSAAGILENKTALKRTGLFIKIFIILLFVWFAGLSPSLLRALINGLLVSCCVFYNIPKVNALSLLSVTFLVHGMIKPEDLLNTGFLFSYSALAGILIASKSVRSLISRFAPLNTAESLSASIGANIFTTPVSIKFFGYFCPGGIISTLFVSPLITFFLYSGLILFILSLCIPFFVSIAGFFMNVLYTLIEGMVKFWSFIPIISFSQS